MSHRHDLPRIGIDLMGSDTPSEVLLKAVTNAAHELHNKVLLDVFTHQKISLPNVRQIEVQDVISMVDDPLSVIKRKKNASLAVGLEMLKNRELDAFITCGNTGALLAFATLFFPMIPGIDRPALMTLLPTLRDPLVVLDVGANVQCKSDHLVQFAQMGIAYQKSRGVTQPRLALLNNGVEENKGTPELREAFQKLKNNPYFVGNCEARDVFRGKIDVLVTDGFTGNIFLKTAEGTGTYILELLKNRVPELIPHLNYAEYPGAILSGIDGIVLKCHGNASPAGLSETIKAALTLHTHHFLPLLRECLNTS